MVKHLEEGAFSELLQSVQGMEKGYGDSCDKTH